MELKDVKVGMKVIVTKPNKNCCKHPLTDKLIDVGNIVTIEAIDSGPWGKSVDIRFGPPSGSHWFRAEWVEPVIDSAESVWTAAVLLIGKCCHDCKGTGKYIGLNEIENCLTCNGTGKGS